MMLYRMPSVKCCHFQWPWKVPNPNFKGTSLFETLRETLRENVSETLRDRHMVVLQQTTSTKWYVASWTVPSRMDLSDLRRSFQVKRFHLITMVKRHMWLTISTVVFKRNECRKLDRSIVVATISQWRRRLSACVMAHDGHFQHIL